MIKNVTLNSDFINQNRCSSVHKNVPEAIDTDSSQKRQENNAVTAYLWYN